MRRPTVIGRQLLMNGTPVHRRGVMPPKFQYPDDVDVWQRLQWDMTQHSRTAHFMEAVARLTADATIEQAQGAIDALGTRLEVDFGNTRDTPDRLGIARLVPLLDEQLGTTVPP